MYTTDLKKANQASEKLETGCVAVNTPVVAVAEVLLENNKLLWSRRWINGHKRLFKY